MEKSERRKAFKAADLLINILERELSESSRFPFLFDLTFGDDLHAEGQLLWQAAFLDKLKNQQDAFNSVRRELKIMAKSWFLRKKQKDKIKKCLVDIEALLKDI